jgi:RND family efflux transporter MFP subunit
MESNHATETKAAPQKSHDSQGNGSDQHGGSAYQVSSHDAVPENLPTIGVKTIVAITVGIIILLAVLFMTRWLPQRAHDQQLEDQANTRANAPPIVNVANPEPQGTETDLILPADVRPMAQTAIFARVDGFLGKWLVDIGDHVDKGQLLAVIDAPDTYAQLNNARASLLQAKANLQSAQVNLELADATYKRYYGLLPSGSVTQQDLDTRQTTANQAAAAKAAGEASVKSAEAQVEQLEALEGFTRIYAPFAGTITFRNYDVGARISASNTTPGQEMFDIEDTDRLRIYVDVPQSFVTLIQQNQPVDFISLRNYANRRFVGYVARTAGALDPQTRTLRSELDFDNKDRALWSGMYGQVYISVHQPHPILTVPTAAMLFNANGTQLILVDAEKRAHFRKVVVGQDLGQRLEVLSGVSADDNVVTNPGERLIDGGLVQLASETQKRASNPVAQADQPTTRVAQTDIDPPGGAK